MSSLDELHRMLVAEEPTPRGPDGEELIYLVEIDAEGNPTDAPLRTEPLKDWMARGRVPDCDCGLLQCQCTVIRQHKPKCMLRLSITAPWNAAPEPCTCHEL